MYQVAHTRLCITPSGPLHIGHAWNALLNKRLAENSGGSFHLRFEVNLLRKRVQAGLIDRWVRENTEELEAFGLGPTEPAVLDADFMADANLIWRLCGGPARWGAWGHQQDMMWRAQAVSMAEASDAHLAEFRDEFMVPAWASRQGILPYWVTFSRVAVDMLSGRNVVMRGADLAVDMQLYSLFAAEIAQRMEGASPPLLLYYPLISSDQIPPPPEAPEISPLSSSKEAVTHGFYLRDLLAQGLDGEWLEKTLWRLLVLNDRHREEWTSRDVTPNAVTELLHHLRPVTILHEQWAEVTA